MVIETIWKIDPSHTNSLSTCPKPIFIFKRPHRTGVENACETVTWVMEDAAGDVVQQTNK